MFLLIKDIELLLILNIFWLFVYIIDKKFHLYLKAVSSIALFNLGVSFGYLIIAFIKDFSPWYYIEYINLKVLLMTVSVFYFFSRVSIIEFFSFSRDFSFLLTITLSQVYTYKKTFKDFRDAFRSRVISVKEKEYVFIKNTFKFFFDKAMSDAKDRALAMKARGFFK
jgi:cobalt/nickel transport system permease protein